MPNAYARLPENVSMFVGAGADLATPGFVELIGATAFSPGDESAERIDVTAFSDVSTPSGAGRRRTFVGGFIETNEGSVGCRKLIGDASQDLMRAAIANGQPIPFRIVETDGENIETTDQLIIVLGENGDVELGGVADIVFNIQRSGEPVVTITPV